MDRPYVGDAARQIAAAPIVEPAVGEQAGKNPDAAEPRPNLVVQVRRDARPLPLEQLSARLREAEATF